MLTTAKSGAVLSPVSHFLLLLKNMFMIRCVLLAYCVFGQMSYRVLCVLYLPTRELQQGGNTQAPI